MAGLIRPEFGKQSVPDALISNYTFQISDFGSWRLGSGLRKSLVVVFVVVLVCALCPATLGAACSGV
jgi:hypothetical protein